MLNKFYDKFVMTNNLHFKDYNFYLEDLPFMLFPAELLAPIFEQSTLDQEKAIYYATKTAMLERVIPRFKQGYGFDDAKFTQFVSTYFTASGFGLVNPLQVDDTQKRALFAVSNSPIAQIMKGKAKRPVDHFLRGALAGLYTFIFKMDVDCVETKCQALGDHSCEFIVQANTQFDFTKKEVQEQLILKL